MAEEITAITLGAEVMFDTNHIRLQVSTDDGRELMILVTTKHFESARDSAQAQIDAFLAAKKGDAPKG